MKNLPLLFCGILIALASSFTGLVLSSYIQLGSLTQTTETLDESGNSVEGDPLFPAKVSGLAQQGKQVYVELGCAYCHTQQVRRAGYGSDVEREWGKRATVSRDYITQERVLIGTQRIGPDLTTTGERLAEQSLAPPAFVQSQVDLRREVYYASVRFPLRNARNRRRSVHEGITVRFRL